MADKVSIFRLGYIISISEALYYRKLLHVLGTLR